MNHPFDKVPRKPRECSYCHAKGHDVRKCPELAKEKAKESAPNEHPQCKSALVPTDGPARDPFGNKYPTPIPTTLEQVDPIARIAALREKRDGLQAELEEYRRVRSSLDERIREDEMEIYHLDKLIVHLRSENARPSSPGMSLGENAADDV